MKQVVKYKADTPEEREFDDEASCLQYEKYEKVKKSLNLIMSKYKIGHGLDSLAGEVTRNQVFIDELIEVLQKCRTL